MALYQDLGSRGPVFGVSDANYQVNPFLLGTGWDVVLDPTVFATNETGMEIYHIALDGPVGSSLVVMRDQKIWDYVNAGWKNGWDPSQPLPIGGTQIGTIQFAWNVAFTNPPYNTTSNVQPQVTVWLRKPLS